MQRKATGQPKQRKTPEECAGDAGELAKVGKALASEQRVLILQLLSQRACCVCALADMLELAQPTVSQHLRVLREAGLIEPVRQANFIHYRPVAGALERWQRALLQCCCSPAERAECCPPAKRTKSTKPQEDKR